MFLFFLVDSIDTPENLQQLLDGTCIHGIVIPQHQRFIIEHGDKPIHNLHFDLSFGRATKALILLEDGQLLSCALTPRTIAGRIDAISTEGGEDSEDHQADSENPFA